MRATAGSVTGPWSATAEVTTSAQSGGETAYEVWLDEFADLPVGFNEATTADNDNDGFTNWQEFIAGTHPADNASIPEITASVTTDASGDSVLTISPAPLTDGRAYSLLVYTNLSADPDVLPVDLTNGAFTVTPGDSPALFYRLLITLP